ncbi:MAG: DF family (seleno)protein [Actinomycetota bacterium]
MPVTRIELLYFDDCPNWEEADRLLQLAVAGRTLPGPDISYRKITSSEEAEAAGFRGSPTILINGRDPFADGSTPVGLSCRVYRIEGRTAGSPSLEQLREALDAEIEAPG